MKKKIMVKPNRGGGWTMTAVPLWPRNPAARCRIRRENGSVFKTCENTVYLLLFGVPPPPSVRCIIISHKHHRRPYKNGGKEEQKKRNNNIVIIVICTTDRIRRSTPPTFRRVGNFILPLALIYHVGTPPPPPPPPLTHEPGATTKAKPTSSR